jgi:hypothetical protein
MSFSPEQSRSRKHPRNGWTTGSGLRLWASLGKLQPVYPCENSLDDVHLFRVQCLQTLVELNRLELLPCMRYSPAERSTSARTCLER